MVWPTAGLVLVALMGGSAEIHASRTAVPNSIGHIRMEFFALGPTAQVLHEHIFRASLILIFTMLPHRILRRLQKARSLSV
jgi:hypothetical protein